MDNRKEGHPKVYRQTPVCAITVEGEVVEAITYVVQPARQRANWWHRPRRTLR